ncbi:hypothetical protein BX666DRAFT_952773 [Dichotomocladium elegans]|nr:hypothetical protein BX666DRAFT_952773 [Dichotomocladium elegans]
MQFNNSQSGYQNFIPVYSNLSPYYQQPEGSATANAMASNIPDDSLLYDMYDYNRAVTATTASTSGTPIIPSQPSPPPSSSSPSPRAQEENVSTAEADRKRPKRRQVKNACVNCQKACKKCDDGRPCQRCIKLGLTATCTNSPRKERKKGVKRGPYKKRQHLDSAHGTFISHNTRERGPLKLTYRIYFY